MGILAPVFRSLLTRGGIESILRKVLVSLGGIVVATGWVSEVEWINLVVGILPIIGGVVWGLINDDKKSGTGSGAPPA